MDRKRASAAAVGETRIVAANKDSFTYAKEKERFLKDLRQFHEGRGTTLPRWPYIGGKPVDLHALYITVTQLGGWEKVSSDEAWIEIQDRFGIPTSCSNADYALRQIYIRYLNAYEKIHHFGQDPDSRDDAGDLDDLPSSSRKKAAIGPVGGVALTYNYHQHNLLDSTREMLGLSTKEANRPSEYVNIERSLMSGLPNELDFAFNICLLLSTEGKHTLKGGKGIRVVELLLSHVGISREAELALIWLVPDSQLNFLRFWNESVDDHEVKELLCPECLLVSKVEEYRAENGIEAVDPSTVLNLGRGLGVEDREAQRVIQLAVIIRNLSFEEENLEFFASSLVLLRFVMLCIYNNHGCIRQLALDTLANIAYKMNLEPVDCGMSQLVMRTVSSCLLSPDKFEVISALETLSRLCQMELNEDAICSQLDESIYETLIRMLTIQDLQLILPALETIYQLSEIGTTASNYIAKVRASVDVLVALLTLDAQSYGMCSVLGISASENPTEVQNPVPGQAMGPPPARPAPVAIQRPPLPCVTPQIPTPVSQTLLSARPPLIVAAPPVSVSTPSLCPDVRTPSMVVVNSEAAACNWLQAQYELSVSSSVKKMEMYRKYASVFGVYGLQNLVSPTCFANCITVAFPSVEQEFVDKDGTSEIVYKGLAMRQKPGSFSPATGSPMIPNVSPGDVLGPAKGGGQALIPTAIQPSIRSVSSTPISVTFPAIQQVLLGNNQAKLETTVADNCKTLLPRTMTATETNFVKTLLASKVTQHMNRLQTQQVDGQENPTKPNEGEECVNMVSAQDPVATQGSEITSKVVRAPILLIGTPADDMKQTESISSTTYQGSICVWKANNNIPTMPVAEHQSVFNEHSYIQTSEGLGGRQEFCISNSENGNSSCVTANQMFVDSVRLDSSSVGGTVDGLANCDSDLVRCFDGVSQKQPPGAVAKTNSCELNSSSVVECNGSQRVAGFSTVTSAVVNGTSTSVNSHMLKEAAMMHENDVMDKSNRKEFSAALNGTVKGIVNGDFFCEKSISSSLEVVENQSQVTVDGFATRGRAFSPIPPMANVDGLYDDVPKIEVNSQCSLQKTNVDANVLLPDPDQTVEGPCQNPSERKLEASCFFSAASPDNSEILLLEDFTVAREEVLVTDAAAEPTGTIHVETNSSSNALNSHFTVAKSTDLLASSQEIAPNSLADITLRADGSSFKNASSTPLSCFQPVPISIPANIQAKLASLQANVSLSAAVRPQANLITLQGTSISQSLGSSRPKLLANSVGVFPQMLPASDSGQQCPSEAVVLPSRTEISSDVTSYDPLSSQPVNNSDIINQPFADNQMVVTGVMQPGSGTPEMSNIPGNQLNPSVVTQSQLIVNSPHGMQPVVQPVLQQQQPENVAPITFVPSSGNVSLNPGVRIQFTSSGAGQSLSNPVRVQPQLHRFISTTTPGGHIIIQRAQLVPQQPQQQSQQLQQTLRPLQQSFFQRFLVSQAGGASPRQIVIQSSQMLMQQGAQGTARPVFVQQSGQAPSGQPVVMQASSGQPVVMQPSGQMLPPQQRHVIQAGQLTNYRLSPIVGHSSHLVQQQVIGQPGQALSPRPLIMQQTQLVGQQNQVVAQQGQPDGKSVQPNGQTADQQQQIQTSHSQMLIPNQVGQTVMQQGQMIAMHQGQVGHILAQQGQLLVGQQGQIICQQGQGQTASPLVIQHSGGQFVLQSSSNGLQKCIMLQQGVGIKRLVETSKDQMSAASCASLSLPLSTTAPCRIVTANTSLHSGLGVTTNGQPPVQAGSLVPASQLSPTAAKKRKCTTATTSTAQARSTKKRKKDGEDQTSGEDPAPGKTAVQYLCEWKGCQRCFGSFNSIFQHAIKDHFEASKEPSMMCEWAGCDSLRRQRWSFMTHLQDRHLNDTSLKAAAARRQQTNSETASPMPSAPPTPAVYPPNAALQAIRRFSARPPFPEMADAKESPVSKHVHLTSALILRNLARYSSVGRSLIKKHEKNLASIAFSDTESSSAISNCLWELHRH